jgi:hypothetical protein
MLRIVLPKLHQLTVPGAAVSGTHHPAAQAVMADLQHKQTLENADFESEFQAQAQTLPLGDSLVLLSKIQRKTRADGNPVLCLQPADGAGIDLPMEPQISHSLLALLEERHGQLNGN